MGDLTIRNKSGVNYNKSGESMPYVVKSVRGYKYVYRQFRVGDKIITEYIGPLDKIVDHYLQENICSQSISLFFPDTIFQKYLHFYFFVHLCLLLPLHQVSSHEHLSPPRINP